MNRISISQAWSHATSFFNGQMANHAIILIGVGIVIPFILQFALMGGAAANMFDPAALASGGAGALAAMSGTVMVLALVNYILQNGSYFASWRLGLSGGQEGVGPALAYGMVAALPFLLLSIVIVIIVGLAAFLIFGSALAPMMMGGAQPSESQAMGAVGLVLLALPIFLLLILWLAARFCCMGPVMADRGTYNILTGLGESWRLTAASQWKIMGYFILIFIVLLVIFFIVGMVAGVSMLASGGAPSGESVIGVVIAALLLGVPMAYLQVAVPAGIYRALGQGNVADVFS